LLFQQKNAIKMLHVIPKIPSYYLFRLIGWPRRLPINLTLSFSYNCNSRCKTCNIFKKKSEELSSEEWGTIFENYGKDLFWLTISGGEPFLRNDLSELICTLYDYCQPSIINIPTNGLLKERITDIVRNVALHCKKAHLVINLSIDEIEDKHDAIRGVPGNYAKAMETLTALKALNISNTSIGIHTVISKFNVTRIPEIYRHLRTLNPDSYITEIAEEREELNTVGAGIAPEYHEYADAVDFLTKELKKNHFNRLGKITRAFRIEYYQMVKMILEKQCQVIPCYAGFASAQIAPDGEVWMCCIKAESVGNVRDAGYDFKKIWFSEKANRLRKSIRNGECYCPLANASYTNMLYDLKTLSRVGWNFIKSK
jgi:MoaA/NifB/PqqE/SkfB family radical SAM enzyme